MNKRIWVNKEFIIFTAVLIAGTALLAFIYFNVYRERGERAFYWGGADSGEYLTLADNILAGRGFSIYREEPYEIGSTRTPGYPLIVAFWKLIGGLYGILLLILFQIGTLGVIGIIAHRIFKRFLDEHTSFLLSFFVVFHPQMLLITFSVMSDLFFILCFLLSFYCFLVFLEREEQYSLFVAAFLLGIATVIRPGGFAVFFLYLIFLLPWFWRSFQNRAVLGRLCIIAGTILLFIFPQAPWSIRNYYQFGTLRPSPADTYVLYYVTLPTVIAERDGIPRKTAQDALHEELVRLPGFTKGRAHDTFIYTASMDKKIKETVIASPFVFLRTTLRQIPVLLLQAEWARPLDKWRIVDPMSENVSVRQEMEMRGFGGAVQALRQKIICGASCFLPFFAILVGMIFWGILFIIAIVGVIVSLYRERFRNQALLCMIALSLYIILIHSTLINVPEIAERYKLPILPFLLIFAVFGWRDIRDFRRRITPQPTVL